MRVPDRTPPPFRKPDGLRSYSMFDLLADILARGLNPTCWEQVCQPSDTRESLM
jgi:hypothetical protein